MRAKDPLLMEDIKAFSESFYIKHGQSPTKAIIAQKLGITPGTVSKYLTYMKEHQMIEYDGYTVHTALTRKYSGQFSSAAILGSVSCGSLQFENESVEGYIPLPEIIFGKGEFYLLRANGDSMINAGISDGDWVVIKKQDFANDGDIVVALVDGMNNLKYYFHNSQKAILRAANPDYDDIEVDELSIQGIATQIIKNV